MLKIKREIWKHILIAVTLSTLFLNHLMEQICTSYALNFFIVESVNCLGKKYVQGWKMYFRGFNGIFGKSIQNISTKQPTKQPMFHCYRYRVRFVGNNKGKSMQQFYINKKVMIFFKNGKLFLRNFEKLLITSEVSWIHGTGCNKICLQHNGP